MRGRPDAIADLRAKARRQNRLALTNSRLVVVMLALVGMLLVVGLGATMSATSVEGILGQSDRLAVFRRQLRWVAVGILVLIAAVRVPYTWYRRTATPILGVSIFGLLMVPMFGSTRGGAERWIEMGAITIQPSEFSKLAVVVFLAAVLTDRRDRLGEPQQVLGPFVLAVGVTCALVVLQPDLGTALIIVGAAGGLALASGMPMRFLAAGGGAGAALAVLSTVLYPYRRERFACFFDPLADTLGSCYQVAQSLMALGSGGLLGVGLGASRARWAYLPNAHTDFIFAIIAEETGFLGAVILILVLAGLSVIGVVIAYRTADMFARLLACGITSWLSIQAVINVGGVVGVVPVTGLALPFVSVGGSAMVAAMAGVGILLNIVRTAPEGAPPEEKKPRAAR